LSTWIEQFEQLEQFEWFVELEFLIE